MSFSLSVFGVFSLYYRSSAVLRALRVHEPESHVRLHALQRPGQLVAVGEEPDVERGAAGWRKMGKRMNNCESQLKEYQTHQKRESIRAGTVGPNCLFYSKVPV